MNILKRDPSMDLTDEEVKVLRSTKVAPEVSDFIARSTDQIGVKISAYGKVASGSFCLRDQRPAGAAINGGWPSCEQYAGSRGDEAHDPCWGQRLQITDRDDLGHVRRISAACSCTGETEPSERVLSLITTTGNGRAIVENRPLVGSGRCS